MFTYSCLLTYLNRLEGQICNLHRLPSLKSSNTYDTFDPSCRSTVIIGDIFEYIQHLDRVDPHPLYDFIITDIYDENTAVYDGSNNSSSNANVHSGIQTLAQLQSVLKPENGIVFFHLHYDIQYEKYEAAIMQAFQGIICYLLTHSLTYSLTYLLQSPVKYSN